MDGPFTPQLVPVRTRVCLSLVALCCVCPGGDLLSGHGIGFTSILVHTGRLSIFGRGRIVHCLVDDVNSPVPELVLEGCDVYHSRHSPDIPMCMDLTGHGVR